MTDDFMTLSEFEQLYFLKYLLKCIGLLLNVDQLLISFLTIPNMPCFGKIK